MKFSKPLVIGAAILLIGFIGVNWWGTRHPKVDFNRDIRPVLNSKCMRCHGGVKRQGELSLLFRQEALKGGESGIPAIVPGNPSESELIRRIKHHDPEIRMPYEGEALSEIEIEQFTQWIREGAEWEDHWAYVAPQLPKVPRVKNNDWAQNEIDHFVLNRLEEAGLNGAAEADRTRLLRRVSLDLIGLPPSLEEVEHFVQDTDPDAYEKAVDRLLSSPHFGERWAAMWLDLARYADSKGYEKDPFRSIWKYRDWVIQAFNEDMPFDQFTIEQLAGDQLPNATERQLYATAFHRNTMNNTEGGTEDEEYRIAAVIDRVNTTWTVWQGTTMECAQCHSHPYDPFLQKEYYQFMAFFNNTQDADLDLESPNLESYTPKQDSAIEEVISWIQEKYPTQPLAPELTTTEKIKHFLYPRLLPGDCDDFEDVELYHNGSSSNWARLPKNIPDKTFYVKFSNLDLSDVTHISYKYGTGGDKGRIEVRRDSVYGPLLQGINLDGKEKRVKAPIERVAGKHDVYFHLINTNAQESDPDGRVQLNEIQLHTAAYPEITDHLRTWQDSLLRIRRKALLTPIMKNRSEGNLRKTHILTRGNWMAPEEEVAPNVPHRLPPLTSKELPERLAVAQWLVSPENPLTARVLVNRFWEQLFGLGLVETAEDFGTQGSKPSHPELLDWLALHLSHDLGWSMKALLKKMVMSATYRQSSVATPDKLENDPENLLLSRGPRIRLSAEQIRDQALAVSGLLSKKMYGPAVMPKQPNGIWQVVYSGIQWKTSEGEDQHRRGIYTYWRRTSPYPSMVSFDSPSREFCVPRRIQTNTPLQALVTLNDPVYVEAAKALAGRMLREGGENLEDQIQYGYRLALMQTPSENTVAVLSELFSESLAQDKPSSEQDSPLAQKVVDVPAEAPELFGLTVVANAILNLDSFIMKE